MSRKSVRDRLKILEQDFKKKEQSEKNVSGISPEKTELYQVMEDYLEQKEDQEQAFSQEAIQPSKGRPVLRNGRFSTVCFGRPFTNFCA